MGNQTKKCVSLTVRRKFLLLELRKQIKQSRREELKLGSPAWRREIHDHIKEYDNDIGIEHLHRWIKNHPWITDETQVIPGMMRYWDMHADKVTTNGKKCSGYPFSHTEAPPPPLTLTQNSRPEVTSSPDISAPFIAKVDPESMDEDDDVIQAQWKFATDLGLFVNVTNTNSDGVPLPIKKRVSYPNPNTSQCRLPDPVNIDLPPNTIRNEFVDESESCPGTQVPVPPPVSISIEETQNTLTDTGTGNNEEEEQSINTSSQQEQLESLSQNPPFDPLASTPSDLTNDLERQMHNLELQIIRTSDPSSAASTSQTPFAAATTTQEQYADGSSSSMPTDYQNFTPGNNAYGYPSYSQWYYYPYGYQNVPYNFQQPSCSWSQQQWSQNGQTSGDGVLHKYELLYAALLRFSTLCQKHGFMKRFIPNIERIYRILERNHKHAVCPLTHKEAIAKKQQQIFAEIKSEHAKKQKNKEPEERDEAESEGDGENVDGENIDGENGDGDQQIKEDPKSPPQGSTQNEDLDEDEMFNSDLGEESEGEEFIDVVNP